MVKYRTRTKQWSTIGCGAALSVDAYRVYILSTLSYIWQLADLPDSFDTTERKACELLFSGPRCWISPAVLRNFKLLSFSANLADAQAAATAAKARVYQFEDRVRGGLNIDARVAKLSRLRSLAPETVIAAHWASWFDNSFLLSIQMLMLKRLRITIFLTQQERS